MLGALCSAVATIGFCMVAVAAAVWFGGLADPPPPTRPNHVVPVRVHGPADDCLNCVKNGLTAVKPE
jgi:hypothetical protein